MHIGLSVINQTIDCGPLNYIRFENPVTLKIRRISVLERSTIKTRRYTHGSV